MFNHIAKELKESRLKSQKFIESKNFDMFIMGLICLDSVVLGLLTSDYFTLHFGILLFALDRLCMAIFMIEMLLKIYVYKSNFFQSKWNIFDFAVIMLSAFSFAPYLIVMRTFRLFRLLKYINRFSKLRRILNVFGALLPNFVAVTLVFAVFLYVFAIISVSLFGSVFLEFATLGNAVFTLLQVFSLDGWASEIAKPVMSVFPNAWVFFVSYLLISFLLILSFVMSVVDEIFHRELLKEISTDCLIEKPEPQRPSKPKNKTGKKKPVKK